MTHEQLKKQRDDLLDALQGMVDAMDADLFELQIAKLAAKVAIANTKESEPNDYAICVHCGVSHHMDDAHTCADTDDPDLLAALEDLVDACEHWENQDDPVLTTAREAIAKAKGGE